MNKREDTNSPFRLLLIDDNPDDRALTLRELKKEFEIQVQEILDAEGFARALKRGDFDIAITDYQLRWSNGLEILSKIKSRYPDCPVIMFTGTGNEEIAVEAMKDGLDDYVIKFSKHFKRLPAAMKAAIKKAKERQTMRETQEALRESEEKYRSLVESTENSIYLVDRDCRYLFINKKHLSRFGLTLDEITGRSYSEFHSKKETNEFVKRVNEVVKTGKSLSYEYRSESDGGYYIRTLSPVKEPDGRINAVTVVSKDITSRKQAEEKLTAALKEKEVLLKEIHHRVKNNMQVISSMLGLQSQHITDKASLEMFQESQSRIRAMALIHEKLYTSEDLSHIDIASYLHSLTRQLIITYRIIASRVNMDIAITDIFLTITTAIPCGLIINELVTNALKHAFPHQRDGTITVSMTPSNTDSLILTVSDTGIGFPEGIDFRNTTTLGMQLVTSLVEQLEGTISLDRSEGTRFRIEFRTQE